MNHEERHSMSEPSANDAATGEPASADQVSNETDAKGDNVGDATAAAWHFSKAAKAAFLLVGVILPVTCFVMAHWLPIQPEWQSGDLGAYAALLLSPNVAFPFFPLLLYSSGSLIAMVFAPARFSQHFAIRFGVYSGVTLSLQYFFTVACAIESDGRLIFVIVSPLLALVGWGIGYIVVASFRKVVKEKSVWQTLPFPMSVLVLGIGVMLLAPKLGQALFNIVVFGSVFCATPWAAIGFLWMSGEVIRYRRGGRWQFSLAQLLAFVSWWALYCSAWRLSIKMMWIEYAKLPATQPTDCYVATAAARGHRRWVGTKPVRTVAGETFWVNDQLRQLKAAELAMAATCPGIHRRIRALYDRFGPPAAAMLVHPLLADAAYVTLKPVEWTARVALRLLVPGSKALIARLYRE